MSENIKVAIKIRPLIDREKKTNKDEKWKAEINNIQCIKYMRWSYTFEHVFLPQSTNYDLYSAVIDPIVKMALNGFNGTVVAYGQALSGKTHTIMGTDDDPGLIFMAIPQIFDRKDVSLDRNFVIRVGYVEIYKEKVYDLLSDRDIVNVLEKNEYGVKLSNKEMIVKDAATTVAILYQGNEKRKTSTSGQQKFSSRAHSMFRIIIESENKIHENGEIQLSHLDIIDLADVELVQDTRKSGCRLTKEGDVNKSLIWLNTVVHELSKGKDDIQFGNSTLTQILKGSLGGTSNTAFVCNINPTAVDETLATLNFANNAKKVQNQPACIKIRTNEIVKEIQRSHMFSNNQYEFMFLTTGTEPKTDHNNIGSSTECGDFGTTQSSNVSSNSSDSLIVQEQVQTIADNHGFTHNTVDKCSNGQQSLLLKNKVERQIEPDVRVEPLAKRQRINKKVSEPSFSPTSTSYDGMECRGHVSEASDKLALERQSIDISNIKAENLRLENELQLAKAAHENDKKNFEEQIKETRLAKVKAEFSHITDKLSFDDFKAVSNRRIDELTNEVEALKVQLRHKTVAFDIEGNSDDKNRFIIRDLRSQLEALHRINKFNSDLLIKQKDSLWRAENENLHLTHKNNWLSKKLEATKRATPSEGVETKIKLLEDTMSKKIESLKMNLGNKNQEITKPWTAYAESSVAMPKTKPWLTPRGEAYSTTTSIPDSFIGCVIGPGGTTLSNIYHSTGAKVIVSPRDGNPTRSVTLTGTANSVSLAAELIKQNIEREKEVRKRYQVKNV